MKGTFPLPSGPSFGFISAVMLGSSPSRRRWWHGAGRSEGQRNSPVQALFGGVMGHQQLPESGLNEVTPILGTGSRVQLF